MFCLFQDVDLNHYRIGKIEGFEVLKKVKVRGTRPCMAGARVALQSASPHWMWVNRSRSVLRGDRAREGATLQRERPSGAFDPEPCRVTGRTLG